MQHPMACGAANKETQAARARQFRRQRVVGQVFQRDLRQMMQRRACGRPRPRRIAQMRQTTQPAAAIAGDINAAPRLPDHRDGGRQAKLVLLALARVDQIPQPHQIGRAQHGQLGPWGDGVDPRGKDRPAGQIMRCGDIQIDLIRRRRQHRFAQHRQRGREPAQEPHRDTSNSDPAQQKPQLANGPAINRSTNAGQPCQGQRYLRKASCHPPRSGQTDRRAAWLPRSR